MPFYQDKNGGLHFLDSAAFQYMLPVGCSAITDAQAEVLLQPPEATAAKLLAESVAVALATGLTVSSTSSPAINGTYPISPDKQIEIGHVELFIEKNGAFPGSSGSSIAWYDISGTAHIFPSVALFSEFATAVANYVADLDLYGAGAPGSSLPSPSVTIS